MRNPITSHNGFSIYGFKIYSNVNLTRELLSPIAKDMEHEVLDMMADGDLSQNSHTLEVGVYDWGNGLNDIRVWRVYKV